MKRTMLICDICHKEITPKTDGTYPRVTLKLQDPGYNPPGVSIQEVCEPCYWKLSKAVLAVVNEPAPQASPAREPCGDLVGYDPCDS